ncbi:MAG: PstA family ABC transporter permease [Pyramidobacter sp.]|jgi:phosphate transport system permease protein
MRSKLLALLAWISAMAVPAAMGVLLWKLLYSGVPTLGTALFFGDTPPLKALFAGAPVWDGIWPAAAGTLTLLALTMVLAVVPGTGCGIYLACFAGPKARRRLGLAVDLLAGVPSIVMGLFGFVLILTLRRLFAPRATTCLLLSAFCLALLALPSLVISTQSVIESLPDGLKLTGEALGFTPWQTVRHLLLPAAGRGVLGGVMLALGRAAEDTAVIMVTGAVANAGLPAGFGAKYEALPFFIFYISSQYTGPEDLQRGFGAALVLLMLSGSLLLGAWALQRSLERKWKGVRQ